jgi:hypothetical protein
MTVQIAHHNHFSLRFEVLDHVLDRGDFRKQNITGLSPNSIHVYATQIATTVPVFDPIDVYHRHDFKYEIFSQCNSLNAVFLKQKIYNSLQYKRTV